MRFFITKYLKFETFYYNFQIPLCSTPFLMALKNNPVRKTLHTLATSVELFKDLLVGDHVSLDLTFLDKDSTATVEFANEQRTVTIGVQVQQTHFFKTSIV